MPKAIIYPALKIRELHVSFHRKTPNGEVRNQPVSQIIVDCVKLIMQDVLCRIDGAGGKEKKTDGEYRRYTQESSKTQSAAIVLRVCGGVSLSSERSYEHQGVKEKIYDMTLKTSQHSQMFVISI